MMNLDRLIESYKEDMINTVIELVSIPSVEGEPEKDKPFGKDVDDALNYVLDFSEKLG
jgi:succinyl-diaminopimelate desuccinylase